MRSLPLLTLAALSAVAGAQQLPAPSADTSEWRMTGVTGTFLDKAYGPGELEEAGNVLVSGESGTGKELVAQAIHQNRMAIRPIPPRPALAR